MTHLRAAARPAFRTAAACTPVGQVGVMRSDISINTDTRPFVKAVLEKKKGVAVERDCALPRPGGKSSGAIGLPCQQGCRHISKVSEACKGHPQHLDWEELTCARCSSSLQH